MKINTDKYPPSYLGHWVTAISALQRTSCSSSNELRRSAFSNALLAIEQNSQMPQTANNVSMSTTDTRFESVFGSSNISGGTFNVTVNNHFHTTAHTVTRTVIKNRSHAQFSQQSITLYSPSILTYVPEHSKHCFCSVLFLLTGSTVMELPILLNYFFL